MKQIESIHFVGIKGVGMAPLAIIAKEAGIVVSGSDISDEFITDKALKKVGIIPLVGFEKEHVKDVDLIITTGAHGGFDNVEVRFAKEKHIPIWTQGRAVGAFMNGEIFGKIQKGISITGTHGKTTTTAMVATILTSAGMDPSFLIGTSDIPSLGQSGHYGTGSYFVAEADEYVSEPIHEIIPKLLLQEPTIAVITNIEFDHPDVYQNESEVIDTMLQFVTKKVKNNGVILLNTDDRNSKRLIQRIPQSQKMVITFGKEEESIHRIQNIHITARETTFSLSMADQGVVDFTLYSGGEHNVYNAAAAILTAWQCGVSIEQLQKGIKAFTGSKRRLEYQGKMQSGALVYDEYAHHPTEIKRSLEALHMMYPEKKILCIFQPHTYSRTKALFHEFSEAFRGVNQVILLDIYASLREIPDKTVSVKDLARQINLIDKNALYLPKPIDVIKYIREKNFDDDTLIVIMGAGDVYKITNDLHIIP